MQFLICYFYLYNYYDYTYTPSKTSITSGVDINTFYNDFILKANRNESQFCFHKYFVHMTFTQSKYLSLKQIIY